MSKAVEFRDFRLKAPDKTLFREVNTNNCILFPVKESLTETWQKISLMIQLYVGGGDYPDGKEQKLRRQMEIERVQVCERMRRLLRCLVECKGYDKDAVSTRAALDLHRAMQAGSWENKPTQLRQISGIGPVTARKLIASNITRVAQLAAMDYVDIERIVGKRPPYGKTLSDSLRGFPRLTLDVSIEGRGKSYPATDQAPTVNVRAVLGWQNRFRPT